MNLNDVKNLNQKRMVAENSLEQKNIQNLIETAVKKEINLPRLDEAEQLVFKIRTELIDYIIEHGLVQGFEFDGNDYPIQNGKIVITKEMIKMVTDKFNYLDESEAEEFINQIMDEQFVVRDQNYVHTDNNFTDEDVNKLNGIEEGAEVNKVIDVTVDGETVLDDSDRIAKITKEIIKKSYESNENTNAFTDVDKTKLNGIDDGAEVNKVDDVLINGRSVLNEQKKAIITKEIIKEAYESNENTNAFTDEEKTKLQELGTWQGQIEGELETINNDIEELGNNVNENTNNITNINQKLNKNLLKNLTTNYNYFTFEDVNNGDIWLFDVSYSIKFTTNERNVILRDRHSQFVGQIETIGKENRISFGHILDKSLTYDPGYIDSISMTFKNNDTEIIASCAEIFESINIESLTVEKIRNLTELGVTDVTIDGSTVLDNGIAKITKEEIKRSYESNTNTNAFTDSDKETIETINEASQSGFILTKSTNGTDVEWLPQESIKFYDFNTYKSESAQLNFNNAYLLYSLINITHEAEIIPLEFQTIVTPKHNTNNQLYGHYSGIIKNIILDLNINIQEVQPGNVQITITGKTTEQNDEYQFLASSIKNIIL